MPQHDACSQFCALLMSLSCLSSYMHAHVPCVGFKQTHMYPTLLLELGAYCLTLVSPASKAFLSKHGYSIS